MTSTACDAHDQKGMESSPRTQKWDWTALVCPRLTGYAVVWNRLPFLWGWASGRLDAILVGSGPKTNKFTRQTLVNRYCGVVEEAEVIPIHSIDTLEGYRVLPCIQRNRVSSKSRCWLAFECGWAHDTIQSAPQTQNNRYYGAADDQY